METLAERIVYSPKLESATRLFRCRKECGYTSSTSDFENDYPLKFHPCFLYIPLPAADACLLSRLQDLQMLETRPREQPETLLFVCNVVSDVAIKKY